MTQPEFLVADSSVRDRLDLDERDAAFVERLWKVYRHLAEKKFAKEFAHPKTSHAKFWEMYLAYVLLQEGLPVAEHFEPDAGRDGPDTLVRMGNQRLWFEANAPDNGTGVDRVPEYPTNSGGCHDMPDK